MKVGPAWPSEPVSLDIGGLANLVPISRFFACHLIEAQKLNVLKYLVKEAGS